MCFDCDSLPPIPAISGAAVSHDELTLQARDGNRLAAFAALNEDDARIFVALGKHHRKAAGRFGAAKQQVDKEAAFEAGHLGPCPCEGRGPSPELSVSDNGKLN